MTVLNIIESTDEQELLENIESNLQRLDSGAKFAMVVAGMCLPTIYQSDQLSQHI